MITFEDDEEDHHDGEDSSGGTYNSKISDKSPNPVKFSQQEGSLVVLVKPKRVTGCSVLNQDSLSVVQVNGEGLSSREGVGILGQLEHLNSLEKISVVVQESKLVLGVGIGSRLIYSKRTSRTGSLHQRIILSRRDPSVVGVLTGSSVPGNIDSNTLRDISCGCRGCTWVESLLIKQVVLSTCEARCPNVSRLIC